MSIVLQAVGHLRWYQSTLLRDAGVLHGFGQKDVSSHLYLQACGAPGAIVPSTQQIHGAQVHCVDQLATAILTGDAFLTVTPDIALAIRTADCLPILWYDPLHHVSAAVHAGWRGLAARVITAAFAEASSRYGTHPRDVVVAIGPAIGASCYEVGSEVIAALDGAGHAPARIARPHGEGKWLLDLAACAVAECRRNGVIPPRIDVTELCTHCHPDAFHSHRRFPRGRGRQESLILMAADIRSRGR